MDVPARAPAQFFQKNLKKNNFLAKNGHFFQKKIQNYFLPKNGRADVRAHVRTLKLI